MKEKEGVYCEDCEKLIEGSAFNYLNHVCSDEHKKKKQEAEEGEATEQTGEAPPADS